MSTSLSEKARGKQRAAEPELDSASTSVPPSKDLTIRFTEGIPDLTVQVAEKDTVKDVKHSIRLARPDLKNRRLRLIHAGQLLPESTPLYHRIFSSEQRKRSPSPEGDEIAESVTEQASIPKTTWLHCSVGPQLEDGEADESKVQTAQLKPLRGFDRLAAAGFSPEDIASIRLQFHTHSAVDYLDQEFDDQEDFDEHARLLEEQWIDSLDGGSAASQSQLTVSPLHNGIVIGFFFPLIPVFFFGSTKPAVFWEDDSEHETANPPVFPRKMQIAIAAGFALNVLFGLWTSLLASV
ncbi:DUF2407 ubiquitin-like domain-containing protein [Cubamyces lactineus]|nr:DUF2407 ubiquitin-like domain-containing protein [Cubamyces lactineus]